MSDDRAAAPLDYDPGLVEEAVFLALRSHAQAPALAPSFHSQREALYELSDPEERERGFQSLCGSWFVRLGLGRPIEQALREQPLISSGVRSCAVGRALRGKDEGAELFVGGDAGQAADRERRVVRLLLRPEAFLAPENLLGFLRHEMLHVSDMLDPAFGYEPVLSATPGAPSHDRLLQDRYRVLWDTTISGRMVRRGWAPCSVRAERLREFTRVFPMLGGEAGEVFARFFEGGPHTHAELASFACDPAATPFTGGRPRRDGRCPLCRLPSYAFVQDPARLPVQALAAISRDFPHWLPSHGICQQCADLYLTASRAAEQQST